jgi:tetratricopeptide (TPR) repeat protein
MRKTLILFTVAVEALAQQHPTEGEKPVTLLAGLGVYHHDIRTTNTEAQKFFDQGLNLLYGFNRYEALRSFRKAAELDPDAALPYWGIAMTMAPHINMDLDGDVQMKESCEAIQTGLRLRGAPEQERAYLEAAAARCPEDRPRAYQEAMHRLMERYPDDFDAATFYVESLMIPVRWRWWSHDGKPAEGMEEAVRVLEATMRRNPLHPGANHFYIHLVESSPSPERAIASAQRLMGLVPSAGHLVHMPGHIWMVLGDFELVASTNERAAQVDREYMQQTGVVASSYAGYYVHNLHFIAVGRSMQGRMGDSLRSADTLGSAVAPYVDMMAMMVDAFAPWPYFARLRFNRWDDILRLEKPDARLLATTALWHYARSIALVSKGQRPEALAERKEFEAARAKVPADWIWLNNKASQLLNVAAACLDAKLAANERAAVPSWRRAIEFQDQFIYDEPPGWYYPVRESLGAALLRSGQAAEAEAVFRDGVARSPRNGRMLFGLMESLKAQNKTAAATLVQREYEDAWKRADYDLSVPAL